MENEKDLIKVLWVENEDGIVDSIKEHAELYGLELVHFDNWDEAKKQLENYYEYRQWSAIILDAKCPLDKDGDDDASSFLNEVLTEIENYGKKYHIIPWYVLSAGDEKEATIKAIKRHNKYREIWDLDWKDYYYSKAGEEKDKLFKRIAKIVPDFVVNYQIRFEYADILNSLETDLQNKIIDLIHEIIYKSNKTNDLLFNGMRKIIDEIVYPKMEKLGFFSGIPDIKTMNGKSIFFDKQYKDKYPHIVRALHTVVEVTQNGSHRDEKSIIAKTVSKGNAPYLLRSCLYELLNIIYWLNQEERMNLRT